MKQLYKNKHSGVLVALIGRANIWPHFVVYQTQEFFDFTTRKRFDRDFEIETEEIAEEGDASLTPLEAAEKKVIATYLLKHNGVKNRARKSLGITINTLNAKLIKYGIVAKKKSFHTQEA